MYEFRYPSDDPGVPFNPFQPSNEEVFAETPHPQPESYNFFQFDDVPPPSSEHYGQEQFPDSYYDFIAAVPMEVAPPLSPQYELALASPLAMPCLEGDPSSSPTSGGSYFPNDLCNYVSAFSPTISNI